MKINPRGYWENETVEGHGVDKELAKALAEFFLKQETDYPILSILDLGCGSGYYTNYLNEYTDFKSLMCRGYDGNPNTQKIAGYNCSTADLSKPFPEELTPFPSDWVLSLEVGEHIPEEYETIFIENLVRHSKRGMIISWAIPGQGGDGHFNCRTNEYIRDKICSYGFKYDINSTMFLRDSTSSYPQTGYWFKDTIMVFRRF